MASGHMRRTRNAYKSVIIIQKSSQFGRTVASAINEQGEPSATDELFRLRNDRVYIKISGILVIIISERREYTSKSTEKRKDVKHVTGWLITKGCLKIT